MFWKKIAPKICLILTLGSFLGGCRLGLGDGIPIIGLGKDGKLQAFNISESFGMRKFGKSLNDIGEEVVERLDRRPTPGPWRVSKLIVGLDFSAGFDVGVVGMKLGTLIELRFSPVKS